ncbi:MAG: hypothetical protein HC877_22520 [Thioploca sp.]|nr:hypothetical protein [Thioploca sp.]
MTATITPPKDALNLKRIDPNQRENDYAEALKYYLSIPEQYVNKIIFAENSNSDLSRLKKLVNDTPHNKTVEFIEYLDGNNFPSYYGRGYGELKLIDYAVDNSKILTEEDVIWKVTGRYKLLNIIKLINTQPKTFSIYCDLIKYKINLVDTKVYAFTLQGYRKYLYNKYHILKEKDELNGPKNMMISGVTWFAFLYANLHDQRIVPRFKYVPNFRGVVGVRGENFVSLRQRRKYILRSIFRIIFPQIWV